MTETEEKLQQREEELKVIAEITSDFKEYARVNLKIQTKNSTLIPLTLNNVQEMLEEIWKDIEKSGLAIRLYILKARQFGVSTWLTGRYFWRTATDFNRRSMIVTHEPKATESLFAMQKRYLDNLQPEYKPETKYNNQGRIVFNTPDGKGFDSSIVVGTANVDNLGSAMTIHDLHLSESAKYPKTSQKELETSLLQAVPKKAKNTAVVFESTANGMGGEFYNGFKACRFRYEFYLDSLKVPKWRKTINPDADPNNNYAAIFIPAFVFYEYRLPVPKGFIRTAEEKKLIATYNCPDEYLQWRRDTLANECKGDINKYHQEYPHNAKEAFIASGTPSFDVEKLIEFQQKCPKPIARYEVSLALKQFISRPNDGQLQVWEEPRPGIPFVVSADVSEGLVHGDFDSASVWNHATGKQAAHYHGHMTPFDFAFFLFLLGKRYNNAWIVPERNNHGMAVVGKLQELSYSMLYVERIVDPPNKTRNRYGWMTDKKTRPLILDTLKLALSTDNHGIRCKEFFDEAMNFKRQDDGKEEADEGTFDDRVIEAAIGKYCLKKLPASRGVGRASSEQKSGEQASVNGFT